MAFIDTDETSPSQMRELRRGRLRRSTLVALRWTAVSGQTFAILIVALALGFELPLMACAIVIGTSAALNAAITISVPLDRRVSDGEAIGQLGFDILQLAVLLWLTGGMQNPFALLFIAPVTTGATMLRANVMAVLLALMATVTGILIVWSMPLPWSPANGFEAPQLYVVGSWIALMTGAAFTSLYTWRSSAEARRMSDALAATEAVLAHEQRLAALGGLAAAAAHELGTPLGTIQVTAKEMARELPEDTPLGEDARLLVSQARRCRDILQQLAQRGDERDIVHSRMSIRALIEEAAEPFIGFGPHVDIVVKNLSNREDHFAPDIWRQAELTYGLSNFIENAVDFAGDQVRLTGTWSEGEIAIHIEDDGPGFEAGVLDKLGEPYVSLRTEKTGAGGLGLGFFISKTLLERTGGAIKFGNRSELGGARVSIIWPLTSIVPKEDIKTGIAQ